MNIWLYIFNHFMYTTISTYYVNYNWNLQQNSLLKNA